jgi:Lrp/AsnC family transcriptional regulator, regulator for asnA, asnC and gidA
VEDIKNDSWCHELDEIDRQIVIFLEKNARMPFTKIAEKLDVSERTVRIRVAQMQEDGILSLVGVVNPIKVGLNVQTFVHLSVQPNRIEEVVSQLKEMEEVRWIALTTGEYPLMLDVLTRDYDDLSDFVMNKLNNIEGVDRTNVVNVLKKMKSRFNFMR